MTVCNVPWDSSFCGRPHIHFIDASHMQSPEQRSTNCTNSMMLTVVLCAVLIQPLPRVPQVRLHSLASERMAKCNSKLSVPAPKATAKVADSLKEFRESRCLLRKLHLVGSPEIAYILFKDDDSYTGLTNKHLLVP